MGKRSGVREMPREERANSTRYKNAARDQTV